MENDDAKIIQPTISGWKKIPPTVGFRLDKEHKRVLFERARLLKMSIHDLARQYVIQMLHEADERQQIISAIVALRGEICEARKDVAVSTQELLVSAGRATVSQAQGWVKENLAPN
jgi:isochorismate hydrolase